MDRTKKTELITQLKQKGFKQIKNYQSLYINQKGEIINTITGVLLTPHNKGKYIIYKGKHLNIAKLLLQEFVNENYRENATITYIDGNCKNLSIENIKYKNIFGTEQHRIVIDNTKLITAIRCYFKIKKTYKGRDQIQTKIYLQTITGIRHYFVFKKNDKYINVFETYINNLAYTIKNTAIKHNISVADCSFIIKNFITQLINEITTDLSKGLLQLNEYEKKSVNTTAKALKQWENYKKNFFQENNEKLYIKKQNSEQPTPIIYIINKKLSKFYC